MDLNRLEQISLLITGIAVLYFGFIQVQLFGVAGLLGTVIALVFVLTVLVGLHVRG